MLPLTELRLALSIVVHAMVDDPAAVQIDTEEIPSGIKFRVQVAERDCGKLIGANGRTARSLRIILATISNAQGQRYLLDVCE